MKLNIKGAMTAAGWGGHFSPHCSNYFANITTTNVSLGYKTISHTHRDTAKHQPTNELIKINVH
jgi:hypothetical protein